jgi:2'-5' RNA ligase
MRCFLAVDLPDRLAADVRAVQERFADAAGLRPVAPESAHVTLTFLGDVDPGRLDDAAAATERAVDAANVESFDVTVAGLGVFPSLDYISVVWAGVAQGSDELSRLAAAIERETTAVGFDPVDHDFLAHVTVGRMDDARGKSRVQRVVSEESPTVGTFRATEVRLKESTLGAGGPTYDTVKRFAL